MRPQFSPASFAICLAAALAPLLAAAEPTAGDDFWQARHQWVREAARKWSESTAQPAGRGIDWHFRQARSARQLGPRLSDAAFFRRLSLDVRGRIPTLAEVEQYLADQGPARRQRAVDRMLASSEWADSWVGYWQDVLAENPSLVYPTLNNSGPFRQWIHESFRDHVPFDRFATELILMEGEPQEGGTAGFALATNNDAPLAMKAHVIVKAFWAVDLKCARCHDSPAGTYRQEQLFQLAAMLNDGPLKVPATSVAAPEVLLAGRRASVTTSLEAGQQVAPAWPRLRGTDKAAMAAELMPVQPGRRRAELAALITSPHDSRFSDVAVNRIWQRYMGAGLVEPVDHWDDGSDSHLQLRRFLSGRFVESGYDVQALARLILTSEAYQRQAAESPAADSPAPAAAVRPRMVTAEQLVDSLFVAVGKSFRAETLALHATDPGAVDLPQPQRAWQFLALPNERDRPALALPVSQTIVDVMQAFGWNGSRQQPHSSREQAVTAVQPLMLFNGLMSQRIVRLSDTSSITELCLQDVTVEELTDQLFLTVLTRLPSDEERRRFVQLLLSGFDERRTGKPRQEVPPLSEFQPDWRKHLEPDQTRLLLEAQQQVARGEPPTQRLTDDFRERVEDALWALINTPEFVLVP